MKVLIVEDNTNDRRLLRFILEHYGCTVIEAQDGLQGLELAGIHKPDIIVSDALMPRMDGFQFLRTMKSEPSLSAIPFLFYSAVYTGEAEEKLALSLGAAAFVVKPTEPEELWKIIGVIMESAETRQEMAVLPSIDEGEEHFFREYSHVVATKLEEKVIELSREIDERKRAEDALKEQEQELATIFENAPFMMLLLDEERRVYKVNGQTSALTGSTTSDMIGRRSGEALRCLHVLDSLEGCGFSPNCCNCAIRLAVLDSFDTGQNHRQVEATLPLFVQGKQQTIPFLVSTTTVMVAQKMMILLALQDISEYKKLEAELHHAQKMESVGTLAGGIAHDLNNILTVIIGYGQITLMKMTTEDSHRKNIENMLEAAQRATSLTNNLLLFSRKQVGEKKNVDLNEIVRSVEKFLRRVIREDIVCSITLGEGKLPILADELQIEQVLLNLGTNARDAMPHGGSLEIVTERAHYDEKSITAHGLQKPGTYAVLSVTDTGMGMNEITRQQIFDPFFTTKEVGKGTGLGLAVTYGIIKQHDGHITVSSEPGHGTSFLIYLPITASPVHEKEMTSIHKKPDSGTETILLAEDDEIVRDMVVSLLENFGYDVIIACDGEDAVEKFRENRNRIRLLLFDVIMPKQNGIAAYEQIKAIEPGVKVIFASGYEAEEVHQKVLDNDNVVSISKPYLPSSLLAIVRDTLDN